MRTQISKTGFVVATLLFCSSSAWATLSGYMQDFEGLNQPDPDALANDGWIVFGNVWEGAAYSSDYLFGYGPFGAPNGGPAFSGIDVGQGGPDQGGQQLAVYSDYNCCFGPGPGDSGHFGGTAVESNVYQEQIIGAENVGEIWTFEFDAKRGNIEGSSTAAAFIKTVDLSTPDPDGEFLVTNFITVNTTNIDSLWSSYAINIMIDAGLVGQVLQFGFLNVATNFEGSGIFYDNVEFSLVPLPAAVWLLASGVAGLFGFRRLSGGT